MFLLSKIYVFTFKYVDSNTIMSRYVRFDEWKLDIDWLEINVRNRRESLLIVGFSKNYSKWGDQNNGIASKSTKNEAKGETR